MLKSPLPAPARRALGLVSVAAVSLAGAAAAWAAQPGPAGSPTNAAPVGAIPNNGHLEPAEAAKLVGPGQTMMCKPDANRELHNCKVMGTPFAVIATAADVAREWPAEAKAKGLTGWVTLQCTANTPAGRLENCAGYHYGGAAERPELTAAFEKAAVRVISVIRLKTNPGADDAPLPKTPGFYTIEFNDHPHLPGGPPGNPPTSRYPDFLPMAPKPAKGSAPAPVPVSRVPVSYVASAPAANPAPLVTQPDWVIKPTGADLADVYPPVAVKAGLAGAATIGCAVSAEGRLADCHVVSEAPAQAGFGEAALKLSERFQMNPMSRDGRPVSGGVVRVPIRFLLPTPAAAAPQS